MFVDICITKISAYVRRVSQVIKWVNKKWEMKVELKNRKNRTEKRKTKGEI